MTSDLAIAMTPRLNRYIAQIPHVRQAAALLLPQEEAMVGGAGAGGKSSYLLMAALQYFDVPGYAALILRKTSTSLHLPGGLIDRSREWLAGTGATWSAQNKRWTSPEGATLTFSYLRSRGDETRYSSTEFQFIAFEELCDFPREEAYTFLFSRLRCAVDKGELSQVPLRMRSTSNPDGVGFDWVKRYFVDRDNTADRIYFPAKVSDNPSINKDNYLKMLRKMGPVMFRKYGLGDWSAVVAGEYFSRKKILQAEPPSVFVKEVRFWDPAATAVSENSKDPDWMCGLRLGIDALDRVWILDVHMFRENPGGVKTEVSETIKRDGVGVYHRMFIDPGSAGKTVVFNHALKLKKYKLEGVRISGDKETLAGGISAECEAGNLYISNRVSKNYDLFMTQLDKFPHAKHDDGVDALSGAYNFLVGARPKVVSVIGPRVF